MYRTTILLFLSLNWMHFLASSSRLHAEEDAFEDLLEEEASAAEDFDKLPQSLFIEAEEMMGVSEKAEEGKAWQFSAVPSYTSRKCCNWTSHGLLTQRIRIPKEGVYAVWPRYRLESDKKAPFELRIEKDGKPIFKHRYYSFQVRSGMVKQLQDERHLWFDIAGLQEGVFSGKEWAWETAEAKLPAGEATLIIEPLGGTRDFTLTLDAILLTASTSYRPNFVDFGNVWARYRLLEVEPKNAEFNLEVVVMWLRGVLIHGQIQIAASGKTLTAPGGKPLSVGQTSTWDELHEQLKYGLPYCTATFSPPTYQQAGITKLKAEIDVGWGNRPSQIIKTLTVVADVGFAVGIAMPSDYARKRDEVVTSVWPSSFTNTFWTFKDLSKERHDRIAKLVPEPVATSKYFNFCTGVSPPGYTYASSDIFKLELLSVSRLGINSLYAAGLSWPRKLGLGDKFPDRYYTAGASPSRYWVRLTCPNHPLVPKHADETMRLGAEAFIKETNDPNAGARAYGMKIGDEIGVEVDEPHLDTCEDCQYKFRQYLQKEGFDPSRFSLSWEDVRWTSKVEATDEFRRALYYYSVLFLSANTGYIHAELTKAAEKHYAPKFPATYNVNPTPVMGGMALDWFEMERQHGINAQWMEVLGHPQPGRESFLADLAWGITRRRDLAIGVYLIYVAPKRAARDTLSFAARGCKSFIFYNYGPKTLGAADNFSESDPTIQAVAESTRPIVAAEEFLHEAVRPPRQACMIYSRTAEIWDDDNAVVRDRVFTYCALLHAQIPMDIISEIDVQEGRLSNYNVAYLNGGHLRRDVAQKVRDWVEAGGVVWASAGAAMRDEADSRLDVLEPVFGARQKYMERKFLVNFGYHHGVTPNSEMYKVNWKPGARGEGGETECVIQRSVIEPAGGEVVATFDDGQPAAITNKFGKGQSTLLAYAAGLTYSRFYRRTDLTYPIRYDALDRAVVIQAALDAGVVRPVKVSKPGVEATRLDSKAGTAIALIDHWVQEPTVTIELPFEKKPQKVRSVTSGDLQFKYENGQISFEVSFDNLDIVTIE